MVGVESQGFAAQFLHAKDVSSFRALPVGVLSFLPRMVKFNLPSVGTLYVMLTCIIFLLAVRQSSLQPLPRGDCGHRNVCDAGVMQPSELAGHLHPIKSAL